MKEGAAWINAHYRPAQTWLVMCDAFDALEEGSSSIRNRLLMLDDPQLGESHIPSKTAKRFEGRAENLRDAYVQALERFINAL